MPAQTIHLNDSICQLFVGGRVEVCHGAYEIDVR